MPSDEIVISVRNVSKTYRIFRHAGDRLKQAMTLGLCKYHKKFTALKDISFDVMKGETIGIIGRNGAGKSTLLQLLCGIIKPTSGTIQVNGRISAMLELGAGFNPEFTGRENAYFQGFLMGFTEVQMRNRFDEIEAFAEIGDFMDQPVRTYSSGMFMRLAFAVAVHVDPDILIIDEILAVGDIMFQQKCFELIHRVQSKGTTIIWVSHHPYQIERLCHRATVLEAGQMSDLRPAKEILAKYYELAQEGLTIPSTVNQTSRVGTHELYFEDVRVEAENGDKVVLTTEPMYILADIVATRPMDNIRFRFELCSASNDIIMVFASRGFSETKKFSGKHRILFRIDNCQLTSGWYYINAFVVNRHVRLDAWQRAIDFKVLLRDKRAQDFSLDQGVFVTNGQWGFSEQLNEVSRAS